MPNKHTTDGNYRYAFQGQEKDGETGMEAFELRLWDGRLGRWLTVDPQHQYPSPYLGMGNNPISRIDPDGGSDDFYKQLDSNGNGTGVYEWFEGSGQIEGYQHLGVAFTDSTTGAWGESRYGSIVTGDANGNFFHHNNTLNEIVINVASKSGSLNDGFYGVPVLGKMYVTDDWGDLQKRHHNGLDIVYKNGGQINGADVYSPISGQVMKICTFEDGNKGGVRIRIKDANVDEHALYHLQVGSNKHLLNVHHVTLGQKIGKVGSTGGSSGPHLHYEIWRDGNRKDRPNPATINPFLKNLPKR